MAVESERAVILSVQSSATFVLARKVHHLQHVRFPLRLFDIKCKILFIVEKWIVKVHTSNITASGDDGAVEVFRRYLVVCPSFP